MAEQKKRLTEDEIARRAATNKPLDPSQGDTPQARTGAALRGMGESVGIYADTLGKNVRASLKRQRETIKNVGGFLVDSAATAGQTGVMGNTRDLPGAGMQTPQQQGLRGAPVFEPKPAAPTPPTKPSDGNTATNATPVQTSTPATAPAGTAAGSTAVNNASVLRQMGVTNPDIAPVGDTRAAIRAGSDEFVNLGNYGQAGQGNIYGKSSTPGGRLDTFVGAGPNAGAQQLNAQGQVVTGGQVYNPTGYSNANPYGNAASRAPINRGLRAGNRQFGGGQGGIRANELRRINQQANRAFNQALESGMNTKAAQRISESIRAGAGVLNDFDQNAARRYGADQSLRATQYASDASLAGSLAATQQRQTAAEASQLSRQQQAQFELFADQFTDAEGNRDNATLARIVQNAGGLQRVMNASPEIQQKLATRGSGLSQILSNVNQITGKDGVLYSTIDALSGGARIPQSDMTIMDAMRSGNATLWGAITGADKVELADGTIIPADEFWGDLDEGTLAKMSAEDRRDLVELTGE